MDIRTLRLIVAVHDEATLTAAAQELHVSRQAVGKALQTAEHEFGTRLFERRAGRFYPTEAGRAAVEDARGVLTAYDDFCREHVGARRRTRGEAQTVSVALVSGGSGGLPAGFFERFAAARNNVRLEVEEMSTDAVLACIAAGRGDVGIVGSHPSLLADFETCPILLVGTWVLAPEDHPFARRSSVGLADLDGQPLVTAGRHNHLHRFVIDRCERAGVRPNVLASVTDVDMILTIARKTDALCFGFSPDVAPAPAGMRIVRLDIAGGDLIGTYAIRTHGAQSSAARLFWRYVQAYEG